MRQHWLFGLMALNWQNRKDGRLAGLQNRPKWTGNRQRWSGQAEGRIALGEGGRARRITPTRLRMKSKDCFELAIERISRCPTSTGEDGWRQWQLLA